MAEMDYKPNSHKYHEDRKRVEGEKKRANKVATGKVKVKKKNGIHKFTDIFSASDIDEVRDYIVNDLIIPTAKKTLLDIISNGADMMIYGSTGHSRRSDSRDRVSYRDYYRGRDRSEPRSRSNRDDEGIITYETRREAEDVLDELEDRIREYGVATVLDMYDASDSSAPHTADRYGWTSLRNASVKRVRDGYILDMPKAMPVD